MQHSNVTNLHPMTLAEAKALLASIDYRHDWTTAELIAPKGLARLAAEKAGA